MLDNVSVTTASLALATGIFAVAVSLLFWLRYEREQRDENLSEADLDHFSRQDRRRNIGLAILLILAQGIAVSPQIDRRVAGRPNLLFLLVWLAIFLLILLLLALAFVDLIATRVYAKRHREEILRARNDLLIEIEQIAREDRIKREAENPASNGTDH